MTRSCPRRLQCRLVVALLASLSLAVTAGVGPAAATDRVYTVAGHSEGGTRTVKGPATNVGFDHVEDMVPLADGGFLVADSRETYTAVDRVSGSGWISRVARLPSGLDQDLARMPDGSLLMTDAFSCRVFRHSPGGTVTRVAGTSDCAYGASGPLGDGGPATSAPLAGVSGVAALPGGSFVLSEEGGSDRPGLGRVREVRPDGRIRTVARGLDSPTEVAPAAGGFLVNDLHGVHQVRPDGASRLLAPRAPESDDWWTLSETGTFYNAQQVGGLRLRRPRAGGVFDTLLRGAVPDFFGGGGDTTTRAFVETRERPPSFGDVRDNLDVEPSTQGDVLVSDGDEVLMLAPSGRSRLGIAIGRESLRGLIRRRLRTRLTRRARVEVQMLRRHRLAFKRTIRARAGLNTIRLPRRLGGDMYFARVRATAGDGSVATDRMWVLVGGLLPARVAKSRADWGPVRAAEDYGTESVGRCHRFSRRRVDCVVREEFEESSDTPCVRVVAVRLRRSGYLYLRSYGCRKRRRAGYFRRSPRWTGRSRQALPLNREPG